MSSDRPRDAMHHLAEAIERLDLAAASLATSGELRYALGDAVDVVKRVFDELAERRRVQQERIRAGQAAARALREEAP